METLDPEVKPAPAASVPAEVSELPIAAWFREEGELELASGNRPFVIQGEDNVWVRGDRKHRSLCCPGERRQVGWSASAFSYRKGRRIDLWDGSGTLWPGLMDSSP